ncbi:MAG: aspartate aminotransferase family protein [Bacteroidota bacterium]|nr:aspartate aminotransferase family protein [Bacteroidota bacterium]
MNQRELFFRHLAQTSASPLALEIVRAEAMHLYDGNGKSYLDLIGGISVCNTGHRHPRVVEAIRKQTDQYLHILVYGEMLQSPQIQYASLITTHLPESLQSVYFTNSGAEATEGAMKLAKRATGRTQIVAFHHSYHGSTQGALSVMGDEYWRNAFRPLLPGVVHLDYNAFDQLDQLNAHTACVIVETVQAENGVIKPAFATTYAKASAVEAVNRQPTTVNEKNFLHALRKKCDECGALLILDEIQTGFGRTGTLWGFEQYDVVPDILLLGKALGGGLPLGAFIAKKELMDTLMDRPVLGHITTFGGHPLSCAAGLASMNVLLDEGLVETVQEKEKIFLQQLVHPAIRSVRSAGLLIAVEFESFEKNKQVIDFCIAHGLLTDWFLFASNCLRIAPPLTISDEEIRWACGVILKAIDSSG